MEESMMLESNKSDKKFIKKNSLHKGDNSENNYQDLTDVVLDVHDKDSKIPIIKKKRQLYLDYNSAQIESFLVSDKPYQQLSDHFGLSVDFKFREIEPNEV